MPHLKGPAPPSLLLLEIFWNARPLLFGGMPGLCFLALAIVLRNAAIRN